MGQPLSQAGNFRGRIKEYGLNKADSGATSIYIGLFAVEEAYDHEAGEWVDWREHDIETTGDVWIIKKDGKLNDRAVRSLIDHAGWDGSIASVAAGTWEPTPCQVVVTEDEYNGDVRFKIAFVNDFDRKPGGGNVSPDDAAALDSKYGSQLRALAGNKSRNGSAPKGSPSKPKPAPAKAGKSDAPDDIPF